MRQTLFKPSFQRLQSSPTQLVMGTVGLTLLLFAPLAWMTGKSYRSFNRIQTQEFRLRQLSDQITYFDEVLTMSAKMAAATGHQKWQKRYRETEPKLDAVIQESITLGKDTEYNKADAERTDEANRQLVAMENEAFELIQAGRKADALAVLYSQAYQGWKTEYNTGVTQRNQAIQDHLDRKIEEYRQHLLASIGIAGMSVLLLLPCWILVLQVLKGYLKNLRQTQGALEASNQRLATTNRDLEQIVAARSAKLVAQNQQLEQTLRELKTAQGQLIQNEKMAVMGELVAGVAHEINNPVGFIAGNLAPATAYVADLLELIRLYGSKPCSSDSDVIALAQEIDLDFVQQDLPKLINSMQTGINRIEDVSCSLRTLARADVSEKSEFDLETGLEGTILILRHRLKASADRPEIKVITNFDGNCQVECFPGQINQVFMNLMANSIDAIDEKVTQQSKEFDPQAPTVPGDFIEISGKRRADCVEFTLKDTGGGISEDIQPKIFENLFTTKSAGKGTGLGLAIVQKIIVENHGGSINLESTLGEGTTFSFSLPLNH